MIFYADLPKVAQVYFQNPASPVMEGIIALYNTIFFFAIIISSFVFFMLLSIFVEFVLKGVLLNFIREQEENFFKNAFYDFYSYVVLVYSHVPNYNLSRKYFPLYYVSSNYIWKKWTHHSKLEIIWTLIPTFILILIAVPSFVLLYSLDAGASDPFSLTIKVIGHQWYWTYEFPSSREVLTSMDFGTYFDLKNDIKKFDSYMVPVEEFLKNPRYPRLLEARPALWIPAQRYIRCVVTSMDVIHSWAIPSLGIKIDAVPGRINQVFLYAKRAGIFYGQCSEICGVNHGFMPIKVIAIDNIASKVI